MGALSAEELRKRWLDNAGLLDRKRHFANYSPKQLAEVLKKGYLGRWRPDEAIRIAREAAALGYAMRTPRFVDDMRNRGFVGEEVQKKLLEVLEEVPPESYKPPGELRSPPGYPFHFYSKVLSCDLYFKFQIRGTTKKPKVLFWSCHPPVYPTK